MCHPPGTDYANFAAWLFELFILGSDPNSDLEINPTTIDENGEPVEVSDPGAIFDLFNPQGPGADLVGPLPQPPPPCAFNIRVNNRVGLPNGKLTSVEDQIKALFGSYVGVNFVASGSADYSLNIANASPGNTNLGEVPVRFGLFSGTPTVFANNIASWVSDYPLSFNNVLGTVGAHELVHRITGMGDIPFSPGAPNDLMSLDSNPNAAKLLIGNGLALSATEGHELQDKCLKKHPE